MRYESDLQCLFFKFSLQSDFCPCPLLYMSRAGLFPMQSKSILFALLLSHVLSILFQWISCCWAIFLGCCMFHGPSYWALLFCCTEITTDLLCVGFHLKSIVLWSANNHVLACAKTHDFCYVENHVLCKQPTTMCQFMLKHMLFPPLQIVCFTASKQQCATFC